jgi:hypothetical protein
MDDVESQLPETDPELEAYTNRCHAAWGELFTAAKAQEELQFAMALNPEVRGEQSAGWSTAEESSRALDQYLELLKKLDPSPIKVRLALSLYSHLSEASGFYEVPKNMMRIASGGDYNFWPFQHLVAKHNASGARIAPNANKIMKDLLGHSHELGLENIKNVIIETFDPDLRNGYAHADYVIWNDGIRLRKRNGGSPYVVSFDDFTFKLNKSITFFLTLQNYIMKCIKSYAIPKRLIGRMNKTDPALPSIIHYDEETGAFSIQTGLGL